MFFSKKENTDKQELRNLSRKDVLELLREQNENPLKKSRAPFCKHMKINI